MSAIKTESAAVRAPNSQPVAALNPHDNVPDTEKEHQDAMAIDKVNDDLLSAQARKRSKVSRACDSCRRKKIKCNADYSTSLQRITKKCDNCVKNQEECTFSRVPLKRGPSKGYIRDLEERLETTVPSPGANSFDLNFQKPKHIVLPPIDHTNGSTNGNSNPKIHRKVSILPSVNSLKSNPNSPSTHTNNSGISSPPIQGPFWKVPYEMPHNYTHGHGNGASVSEMGQATSDASRRSSVESVSSNSTNGSKSRLPSLKPSISVNSEQPSNVISDSDDDYYSVTSFRNSRRSSASLSPRNSISSMSSLNGRIKNVKLGYQPHSSAPTTPNVNNQQPSNQVFPHVLPPGLPQPLGYPFAVQQVPVPPGFQPVPFYQAPQVVGKPPMPQAQEQQYSQAVPQQRPSYQQPSPGQTSLEHNLKIYYSKFHRNFPILPFDETYILSIIKVFDNSKVHDQTRSIIELFSQSLYTLNNYETCNMNDSIQLIYRFLSLYPFNNYGIKLNDSVLYLFFSASILVNYAILLSGNIYSMGISICVSFFNDFKVLENFIDLFKNMNNNELSELSFDSIKLYLPKLYFCLLTIDDFYSLSFGIQKMANNQSNEFIHAKLNYLIPSTFNHDDNFNGLKLLKMHDIVNDLLAARDNVIFDKERHFKLNESIWNNFNEVMCAFKSQKNFSVLFVLLMKDKYELLNFLIEISGLFTNLNFNSNNEEEKNEILQDHHLKLIRLVKNVSQSLMNLSSYFVSIPKTNAVELITPFSNISVSQSYKLLKLSKLIIDSLLHYSNLDSFNRILKINSDLMLCASNLSSACNSDVFGAVYAKLIQNKVNSYALNFLNMPNKPNLNLSSINWKFDFFKYILPFIEKENIDGWL